MSKIIECENITHYYGNRLIYENLSFDVEQGKVLGLLGKNGTGKTTIINILNGYLKPRSGVCRLFGEEMEHLSPLTKSKVGLLLEGHVQHAYFTVSQIEKFYSAFFPKWKKEAYYELLKNLQVLPSQKLSTMSCGQRSQVALGLLFAQDPELLILDEPTVGLDVIARDEVLNMLREYMEENESSSILISSHISSDLESLCDDFYMIHAGKIILHEDTDVLLSDYAVLKVAEEEYEKLDQQYLIKIRKEAYGYRCLTNQKQFYMENYPDVVIENGKIDDLVVMMEEQV